MTRDVSSTDGDGRTPVSGESRGARSSQLREHTLATRGQLLPGVPVGRGQPHAAGKSDRCKPSTIPAAPRAGAA